LKDGPHQDLIMRSPVEVLDHRRVGDVEDVVPHGLDVLEERVAGLIVLAPDRLEVPWLCKIV
jgi:hypothetical protein